MPLKLVHEGEMASQPPSDGAGESSNAAGRRSLQRSETCLQIVFVRNKLITCRSLPASSFYPGYGGATSISDFKTNQLLDPDIDEPPTEDEEDWIDEQAKKMTTLPRGQREKAVALEVRSGCS